jgi:hypothetical protein
LITNESHGDEWVNGAPCDAPRAPRTALRPSAHPNAS